MGYFLCFCVSFFVITEHITLIASESCFPVRQWRIVTEKEPIIFFNIKIYQIYGEQTDIQKIN